MRITKFIPNFTEQEHIFIKKYRISISIYYKIVNLVAVSLNPPKKNCVYKKKAVPLQSNKSASPYSLTARASNSNG